MLNTFKNFVADRLEIDELVTLHAYGKQLRTEFESLGIEEPEYVDVQLKSIRREINVRNQDKNEARRREIRSRLEALKSPDQKRSELEKELAELESKIGA